MSFFTSGFHNFDQQFGLLKAGEVSLIAGRPQMGKTSLLLNMGITSAYKKTKVLFWSLETSIKRVSKYYVLFDMQIIDDISISLDYLDAVLVENKTELLLIDYLQLQCQEENATVFLSKIKAIAVKNQCSVIVTSQLNTHLHERENTDFRPILEDLIDTFQSESPLQYLDHLYYLYSKRYYNPESFFNSIELFTTPESKVKFHWGEKWGLLEEMTGTDEEDLDI